MNLKADSEEKKDAVQSVARKFAKVCAGSIAFNPRLDPTFGKAAKSCSVHPTRPF